MEQLYNDHEPHVVVTSIPTESINPPDFQSQLDLYVMPIEQQYKIYPQLQQQFQQSQTFLSSTSPFVRYETDLTIPPPYSQLGRQSELRPSLIPPSYPPPPYIENVSQNNIREVIQDDYFQPAPDDYDSGTKWFKCPKIKCPNLPSCETIGKMLFCLLALSPVLALAITQIAMGIYYKNQINCASNIMSITNWLIVEGVTMAFIILTYVITPLIQKREHMNRISFVICLLTLIMLLKLIWLVVGSVLFWRDCNNRSDPSPINSLMMASLIIEYIVWGVAYCCGNSKN